MKRRLTSREAAVFELDPLVVVLVVVGSGETFLLGAPLQQTSTSYDLREIIIQARFLHILRSSAQERRRRRFRRDS